MSFFICHLKSLIISMVFLLNLYSSPVAADVVKPALIEISVYTEGKYKIEIRTSIEAILTGINSKYKNTQDSPNSEAYDDLRVLESPELLTRFKPFEKSFITAIILKFDNRPIPLSITNIVIPEPGYTKVPRTSVITLEGNIDRNVKTVSWYYPEKFGDNAVRVRQVDNINEKWFWSPWQWLRNDQASSPISLSEVFTEQSTSKTITTYVTAGFDHILPKGLDHILFILGIFLLSTKMRPLFWQVTMFTLAHSITLSLSMLNIIYLPSNIVEPLIALSIAYIGFENIFSHKLNTHRMFVVFTFGLLHGMGFASMLADFGMPDYAFATALISFNIGVELGQILIIILAFIFVGVWFRKKEWYRNYIITPGSFMIAITGLYWTYDRIAF
jgi:hydrogenase/urease accessory protein HupE